MLGRGSGAPQRADPASSPARPACRRIERDTRHVLSGKDINDLYASAAVSESSASAEGVVREAASDEEL
jgi:hypothetical protein